MVFTHDTEVALGMAVSVVNSVGPPDALATVADLDRWVHAERFTGSRTGDDVELAAMRDLRPVLRRIWTAQRDDAVGLVNALLVQGSALPQLVRHDGWDWHLHATSPDQPLATRVMVEAAMGFVDVIRANEWERLGLCAGDDCDSFVLDLTRNRSRRYCDAGCGNRANVAAYRARQAER